MIFFNLNFQSASGAGKILRLVLLMVFFTFQQGRASVEKDMEKAKILLNQANQILKSDPEQGIIWLKEA